MDLPPNPMAVLAVTFEYLFYLLLSERLHPPAQWKARGLLSESCTPGNAGCPLWPKSLDTISSLQRQMTREPSTPYRIQPRHS
jgi:hypothetical protein